MQRCRRFALLQQAAMAGDYAQPAGATTQPPRAGPPHTARDNTIQIPNSGHAKDGCRACRPTPGALGGECLVACGNSPLATKDDLAPFPRSRPLLPRKARGRELAPLTADRAVPPRSRNRPRGVPRSDVRRLGLGSRFRSRLETARMRAGLRPAATPIRHAIYLTELDSLNAQTKCNTWQRCCHGTLPRRGYNSGRGSRAG